MSTVQTARGPVDTADLGPTLMHEHVFVLTPDVQQNYPQEWGSEEDRVADAVGRLGELAGIGVKTIVDPTVVGLGRYLPRIERLAQQVDVNIVCATGLYTYDDVPFFFHHRGPALNEAVGAEVPDPMVDMFVGDIENGIAGTGVRAAFLKCAWRRRSRPAPTPSWSCAAAATPIGWSCRRTPPATSTGWRRASWTCCPSGTTRTSTTRCCPTCASRG